MSTSQSIPTDPTFLTPRQVGQCGEDIATDHLRDLGYLIQNRNVRTRHGEIDIVALDGDTLVFAEVKTRRSHVMGPGIMAVTPQKVARIRRLAGWYLMEHSPPHRDIRIDALDILLRSGHAPLVDHYRGVQS
ncbi:MAG: YraN family protein [Dermabacter sp.]|nr:YraN family protein [Dermabacter sp.]